MHVRITNVFSSYALCLLLLALLVIAVNGKEGNAKEEQHQQHKKNKLLTSTTMTTTNLNGNNAKEQEHGHAGHHETKTKTNAGKPVPCTCGIFLSGQFKKGSKAAPKGEPVVTEELDMHFAHNSIGQRQCSNKCIENIIKYLPKSADIICSTIDRDCHKEKAYLFTKNYDAKWINSNMSAGREFCCKDNKPYKCPFI